MKKHLNFKTFLYLIFSFLFTSAYILMKKINYNGEFPTDFANSFHFNIAFFLKAFLLSLPLLIIVLIIFKLLDKIKIKDKKSTMSSKKVFLITFISLLITSLILLITYYPGNTMIDSMYMLKAPLGFSAQHPLFYIALIYVPFTLFSKLFSLNFSLFLTCLLQAIIISLILSIIIYWFHNTFKNKVFTTILYLYFTFLPIITDYNTTLVKDSAFSIIMLCIIPLIYEIIISKGSFIKNKKNIFLTITILTLLCLLRNNGTLIIIILLFLLMICYKKYLKNWIIILIITCIFSQIPLIFSEEQLFQEKVGIPLSQLSYIIHEDGKIAKEDKEYLEKLYPLELYKTKYSPYIIDTIKWDADFNRKYLNKHKSEFIKVWINTLPNNFESYVKSYLLITYGNWAPDKFYTDHSIYLGTEDTNPKQFPEIESKKTSLNFMQSFYSKTTKFLSGGICFWLLILISLYIIYKKKYSLLLLTIPLYANWITLMVATPFSLAFRYMSPFMYILPFIILITIFNTRDS